MPDVMFSHSAVHRGKQLAVFNAIHHLWFAVEDVRREFSSCSDAALARQRLCQKTSFIITGLAGSI
jgi:hypothetical protein